MKNKLIMIYFLLISSAPAQYVTSPSGPTEMMVINVNPFLSDNFGQIRLVMAYKDGRRYDMYYIPEVEGDKQLSPGCKILYISYAEKLKLIHDPSDDINKILEEYKKTKLNDRWSGLTDLQLPDKLASHKFKQRQLAQEDLKTANYPTLLYCLGYWDKEVVSSAQSELTRRVNEHRLECINEWLAPSNLESVRNSFRFIKNKLYNLPNLLKRP